MNTQMIDPIQQHWTVESNSIRLAHTVVEQLARHAVADIPRDVVPLLAASAAELSDQIGLEWRVSADDAAVMMIRMISRASLVEPSAGGDHTVALLDRLLEL